MLNRSARVVLTLCFAARVVHGQTKPTVQQDADRSTCSNVVALTGDININCSALTPEQKKMLASIPGILKKILANQIDTKAVVDKLDELIAASSNPTVIQNNSGGINVQQGTTGADSPIINSPITVGSLPKAISAQDMISLKKYFLGATSKSKVKISADQFSGAVPLPDDFYDALKGGGWTMVDAGVNQLMMFSGPGRKFQGAVVTVTGEPLSEGQIVNLDGSDPLFYIGNALQALKIPHSLQRSKDQPERLISIIFEGGFPD